MFILPLLCRETNIRFKGEGQFSQREDRGHRTGMFLASRGDSLQILVLHAVSVGAGGFSEDPGPLGPPSTFLPGKGRCSRPPLWCVPVMRWVLPEAGL